MGYAIIIIKYILFTKPEVLHSVDLFFFFRIGVNGFDNPMRDPKTEEVKKQVGLVSIENHFFFSSQNYIIVNVRELATTLILCVISTESIEFRRTFITT